MFNLIRNVQNLLLQKKHQQQLQLLTYKNLRNYKKPDPILPFDYFVLDKPYANDSTETKQELDEVIASANSRSRQAEETILLIDKDPLIIFKAILKNKQKEFPQHKFDAMYDILYNIVKELKLFYNRPRPNQIAEFYDLRVNVLHTNSHATPAYPSGHTAYAKLAELICIDLFPESANDFREITKKVGQARIKQGVHFASDNAASESLVSAIYDKLEQFYERSL